MIIMKISSSPTSWRIAKSSLKFAQKIIAECNDNGKLRVAEFKKGKKVFELVKEIFYFINIEKHAARKLSLSS